MKKSGGILLAVLLAVSVLLVSASAEPMVAGGWQTNTNDPTAIPQDVADAFTLALFSWTGSNLQPVALLAGQVVAGTNYCLLCKSTLVTQEPIVRYVFAYLYVDLQGGAQILRIADIDYSAFGNPAE